jgi:GNAT superfamily N-acetyltransferase
LREIILNQIRLIIILFLFFIFFRSSRTNTAIGNLISPVLNTYHNLSLRLFPNRAADPSRSSFLDSAVAESERYWTGDRAECWDLHVCGVHPDYQGKGVGKALAQWGVQEAEVEGGNVCASVLCGEKNRGFYGKVGLRVQVGGREGKGGGIALFTQ